MTLFELLLAYLITVGVGVLMSFMPALSRGTTFFAVTVPADFPATDMGQLIARRYAVLTAMATLLALAVIAPLSWIVSGDLAAALIFGLAPMLPVIGALAAFIHCRGIALRFSQQPSQRRQASLRRDTLVDIVPGPLWLHLLPYLVLAAAAGWLALNWSQIPDSVFVPSGLPDGQTATRSVAVVFGLPLIMAASLALCHAVMAMGLLIRRLPGHRGRVRSINTFLLAVIWVMGILGAYNALVVLYGERWINGPVGMLVNVGAPVLVLVLPIWMLLTGRFARAGEVQQGDRSPDRAWKLGLFYFNDADPALFVEKRFGVGYTVNFARPGAWAFIGGILAGTAALLFWAFST
ncbi:MAG: DUF5808 domain-containing protein [Wenzhouxiangella sp.]|jgi:hypothetical protein|nr:DUF5808 domain-containing protein [Wenzhouxiangella sp.]